MAVGATRMRSADVWRTWLFLLASYLGSERLVRARGAWGGRLAIRAGEKLLSGGSVTVRGGAGFGLRLAGRCLPLSHRQGYGLVRGVLEPEVQEALRRSVAAGMVVFDVGANLGFFSLLAARLAGPTGRVVAFEPVAANVEAIRTNASLNGFPAIRVHEVAVSDRNGVGRLSVPRELSWSHLTDRGAHPEAEAEIAVRLIALDDAIEAGQIPAPDVVKIDVEGYEAAALRGLRRTLSAKPITVICELHGANAETIELMQQLGYVSENLESPTPLTAAGPTHALMRRRG